MRAYVHDGEGVVFAFRRDGDLEWSDPHGGIFSAREQRDLTDFAEGRIDDFEFGCPGFRLTIVLDDAN